MSVFDGSSDDALSTRDHRYLYLIVEHPIDRLEGHVVDRSEPYPGAIAGERRVVDVVVEDETEHAVVVGLGNELLPVDGEGTVDPDAWAAACRDRLRRLEDDYLLAAGIDPAAFQEKEGQR